MVEILIEGGNTEIAANDMAVAVRELFGTDPLRAVRSFAAPRGSRSIGELAIIVLAIPPAAHYTLTMAGRLGHLIAKAKTNHEATGARFLIDPGDGKPIPLEEANRETIREALEALGRHPKV